MVRNGGGSIVNVGSVASFHPFEGATANAASKAAVAAMSKAATMELGPQGIRVNVVHPGGILTQMSTPTREISPFYARLALARIGQDDSSYCAGAEFVVYGVWTTGRYSREMSMK
jgi:3alpha(or 20beta)-hydroxysteroid dehydrogenase